MALRSLSIRPGARPADRHTTTYDATRGGWYPAPAGADGQCGGCGQWFSDWNGGTCDACKAIGR